ncbi:Alpha/Beta hydrolase protein [Aspergillus stella-maris]|uniref:Alpha/Beta hydrolase protein n=1 Tax=Aspergillus stella-maris TaxID=1810926 RepID=UPI003CCE2384
MGWFFKSEFFDFEFLRVIGTAPVLGAEVGECLEARSRITDGDIESWHNVWTDLAAQAEALGEEALAVKDETAARWAFLRASNYYRASEFFLHCSPSDARLRKVFRQSVANFQRGIKLLDGERMTLSIPYEDTHLPGYLFLPPVHKRLPGGTPLIIHTGGFDSIGEELYFYVASGATDRGYAVLIFDGPGQGSVLRDQGLPFRPDWEAVISKVLDYALNALIPGPAASHNINPDKTSIFGASMGGYLCLRGAADPRVKACVSCDGFYDMFDITRTRMPSWFIDGWISGWVTDNMFNSVVACLSKQSFQLAWEFGHSMWVYGVDSPADVMRRMQTFTLRLADAGNGGHDTMKSTESDFLAKIQGAVLVTGAKDTMYFTPELNAERIYAKLDHLPDDKKKLWIGEGVSGGGLQAKIGAIAVKQQKMFAWLDEIQAAAALNGLDVALAPNFQMDTDNRSSSFLAKFPLGKVPALEVHDGNGTAIFESDAIAQFVAESGPAHDQLLGETPTERALIRQWICFANNEIMANVTNLVIWRVGMRPFDAAVEEKALEGLRRALACLEAHIASKKEGEWITTAQALSLADLSLASSLYWGFMLIIDENMREEFPGATGWYKRVIAEEGVKAVFKQGTFVEKRRERP